MTKRTNTSALPTVLYKTLTLEQLEACVRGELQAGWRHAGARAGLFLGAGASLPLWTVRAPAYVVFYGNPPPPEPKGSLWAAASVTLDVRDALLLLGAGAVAGLGSYFACPGLRQQKGGGP